MKSRSALRFLFFGILPMLALPACGASNTATSAGPENEAPADGLPLIRTANDISPESTMTIYEMSGRHVSGTAAVDRAEAFVGEWLTELVY